VKVLVVDDQLATRRAFCRRLAAQGFEVSSASSASEALSLVERERPQAIISDVVMRGLNGFALCERVMSAPANADIRFVLVSGIFTSDEDRRAARECGAIDLLQKPVPIEEITSTLCAERSDHAGSSRPAVTLDYEARLIESVENKLVSLETLKKDLALAERRFEFTASTIADGVFEAWPPAHTAIFNSHCKALLGFSDDELGNDVDEWMQLVHPSDLQRVEAVRDQLRTGSQEESVDVVARMVAKNGSIKVIRCRVSVMERSPGGGPVHLIGTLRDISHTREGRAALAELERSGSEAAESLLAPSTFPRLPGGDSIPIIGTSPRFRRTLADAQRVAPTDAPVLLRGETGVGKELFALGIHYGSPRARGPLVQLNCGAISPHLIDSELFGHERGAFTGATEQRKGRFELADKGTLFLDEVAELPLESQVRLLRVLQDGLFQRVGGSKNIECNVRVIAATHRDLEAMVAEGRFRRDLFYRLNVFPIRIPPLRERTEDIPRLAEYFLRVFSNKHHKSIEGFSPAALDALRRREWSGNVRELRNIVERMVILADGTIIEDDHLEASSPPCLDLGGSLKLVDVERAHIQRVLELCGGRIGGPGGAAELLGLHPNTLRSRMLKLGLNPKERSLPRNWTH